MSSNKILLLDRKIQNIESQLISYKKEIIELQKKNLALTQKTSIIENKINTLLNTPDDNITVNKNAVPNDPQSPFVTSGIRVGTPAITTRGFGELEAVELAGWMCDVMDDVNSSDMQQSVKAKVLELCARFPVYK